MTTLSFSPLLPWLVVVPFLLICLGFSAYAVFRRMQGAIPRSLAFLIAGIWLLNPVSHRIAYKPGASDVYVVLDESPSMQMAHRQAEARAALEKIRIATGQESGLNLKIIHATDSGSEGTTLFTDLQNAVTDPRRFAGAIFITDGMVHDAPARLPKIFATDTGRGPRPLDVILTGKNEEMDRQIKVLEAPTYGIVGKDASIVIKVIDHGSAEGHKAQVSLQAGRAAPQHITIETGRAETLKVPVKAAGDMPVVIQVSPLPGEVTTANNLETLHINGIRERLKVLLVSGAPNPGERVWRRLLRSDPAVDLVHFTILRAPEQDDGTSTDEMALVVFPTQALFEKKIDQFDLIILDGFKTMGLLPDAYMENIARFVQGGGGLLLLTGPEFLEDGSLKDTPLAQILPATAEAQGVMDRKFVPQLTPLGQRHPVVNGLPPHWGPWYRALKVAPASVKGDVIMKGPDENPLLVLGQAGDGRVAMLFSDQIWLWSRGEEGGGPQAQLLRRLAHWLMKEPALEAEQLSGRISGDRLDITRHSLQPRMDGPVEVTRPDKSHFMLPLHLNGKGVFTNHAVIHPSPGIWRLKQGDFESFILPEHTETLEGQDLRATSSRLDPLVQRSSGHIVWSDRFDAATRLSLRPGHHLRHVWAFPPGREIDPSRMKTRQILPAWLSALSIILCIFFAWWRERKI
ncbi:glutamine amidotransferase [Candidatus Kirkpatrickella diaphorinae]|uniref:Glutamine amidotransferase n=1 Tax=Candidatus Kirkpatrickella diaphorinae TaxID=2984322 RepID=A0ABY6GIZ7_9PROT|nr:glutamine amidotransferase [Candidatus Kirkpatrickella diaphorinae]UYH51498.1 glutamine amidotransferase [Candidatus Kirkpatrickella diaphorinae]